MGVRSRGLCFKMMGTVRATYGPLSKKESGPPPSGFLIGVGNDGVERNVLHAWQG